MGLEDAFRAQQLGVDAGDQHRLVIGAVEDADDSAFGQFARLAPEKSCAASVAVGS